MAGLRDLSSGWGNAQGRVELEWGQLSEKGSDFQRRHVRLMLKLKPARRSAVLAASYPNLTTFGVFFITCLRVTASMC